MKCKLTFYISASVVGVVEILNTLRKKYPEVEFKLKNPHLGHHTDICIVDDNGVLFNIVENGIKTLIDVIKNYINGRKEII